MKTSNPAFTTFLDQRFIPLAPKAKLGITVLLILLPVVAFYFAFFQPKSEKIQQLTSKKSTIEGQLREVKARAADLAKFEAELTEAENRFLDMATLLPKENEIPKLLTDISALGRGVGLDFLTFKPLAEVPRDFYAEIPISINVRGPFHNMGAFFDQVSKLERIVTVSNVKMTAPKKEGGEMLVNSDCQLVTYRFTNVELPKEPKK